MRAIFRLRVKKSSRSSQTKAHVALDQSTAKEIDPSHGQHLPVYEWGGAVLLTANVSLCMDGARVQGFKYSTGGGQDPSQAKFHFLD